MLAERLNELAQAHNQNLITDDEYRVLRQNAFEADLTNVKSTPTTPKPEKLGFLPRIGRKASTLFFSSAKSSSPTPAPTLNRPSIPSFPPPKPTHKPSPSLSLPSFDLEVPPSSAQIRTLLSNTISESENITTHFDHLEAKARQESERKNARRLIAKTPGDVGEVFAAGWRDYSSPLPSPLSPTRPSALPPPSPISINRPPPSPSKSSKSGISTLLRKASLSSLSTSSRNHNSNTLTIHRSSSKLSADRASQASGSTASGHRSRSGEYTEDSHKSTGRKRSLSSSRSLTRSAGNLTPNPSLLSTSPAGSSSFSHKSQSPRLATHPSRGELGVLTEGHAHSYVNGAKEEEEDDEELGEVQRKKEEVKKRYAERIEYLKAQLKSAELREKARR